MTREEALKILHNASVYHPDYLDALNMAIKALAQEPCKDVVSRQTVIDLMMQKWDENFSGDDAMQESIDAIRDMPSIIPQKRYGEWIPVSERLPLLKYLDKISDDVLITNGYEVDMGYLIEREGKIFWHYYGEIGIKDKDNDATAWMPLPEPYKAESEDE